MYAGRQIGIGTAEASTRVATIAVKGAGLIACPIASPVAFGFGPASFMALYQIAYERALASVAAEPTLYDRLMKPSWN